MASSSGGMSDDDDWAGDDVYVPELGVEDLEEYRPGGYHPVMIGDFYQKRYRVVHKLGFGAHSTIWLAQDERNTQLVALKILTAEESGESKEGTILGQLQATHPTTRVGMRVYPRLHDQFLLDGPNGRHLCLVEEPAGCNIAVSKDESANQMFPIEAARSLTAQLVLGLFDLHSHGICHGDLHLRNLLLRKPGLASLPIGAIYRHYGEPNTVPVRRAHGGNMTPHAPSHVTYPVPFVMRADEVIDPQVMIADYGTAFVVAQGAAAGCLNTPALSMPPEDFFDESITQAADVWTLGVNLYELFGDGPLFEVEASAGVDEILGEVFSLLGKPPERWWAKWEARAGARYHRHPGARPLRQRMWGLATAGDNTPKSYKWGGMEVGELQAFGALLEGMIVLEPTQRLTAEQLIKSEYMTKWALPAWERQEQRMRVDHGTA